MVTFDDRVEVVKAWDLYVKLLGDRPLTEEDSKKREEVEKLRAELKAENKLNI